jgi:anti-anti-sigma factor
MHLTHERVHADRSSGSDTLPRDKRDIASCLTRAPLALIRLEPECGSLRNVEAAVADEGHSAAESQLVMRWARRRTVSVIWLTGALDRTTAPVLEGELDARVIDTIRLVVDLTGLELIDSFGLDALARIHRRAPERGQRLSFRHGQHVAQRPRGLIRATQLSSEWAPRPERLSDDDSYFALAMACVDVDHARPGDRPRAA